MLTLLLAVSCNQAPVKMNFDSCDNADGTDYASVSINAMFPVGDTPAGAAIRGELLDIMYDQWSHVGISEDTTPIMPRYSDNLGAGTDPVAYYSRAILDYLNALAAEDYKTSGRDDIAPWEYRSDLVASFETEDLVVFHHECYFYMGGAHGGVAGAGNMTFDKHSGALFTDFLKPGILKSIQPLLIEGIQDYYATCGESLGVQDLKNRLYIEDGLVPLPAYLPSPEAGGLRFVYQQYEIACYADGMITFVIPYDKIMPYLTPAAIRLLKLG